MVEVERKTTPLKDTDAAALISVIAPSFMSLSREAAELLMAQLWLENGAGKLLDNHNIGNISAYGHTNPFWSGDLFRPPWYDLKEIEALPEDTPQERKDKRTYFSLHDRMLAKPPGAPAKFRSYANFTDGMRDYLRLIASKYSGSILKAAETGNARAFASAVDKSNYCSTDCPADKTVSSLTFFQKSFQNQGLFAGLPRARAAAGVAGGLAVMAVAGGIFWATTRAPKRGRK